MCDGCNTTAHTPKKGEYMFIENGDYLCDIAEKILREKPENVDVIIRDAYVLAGIIHFIGFKTGEASSIYVGEDDT